MLLLASLDDVADRLGRPLTPSDGNVEALIEEASVKVASFVRQVPDPVPDAVRVVASRMAARAITAAGSTGSDGVGVQQVSVTAGPFGVTRGYTPDATAGGVWLSGQDKDVLRPFRQPSRAVSVPTW